MIMMLQNNLKKIQQQILYVERQKSLKIYFCGALLKIYHYSIFLLTAFLINLQPRIIIQKKQKKKQQFVLLENNYIKANLSNFEYNFMIYFLFYCEKHQDSQHAIFSICEELIIIIMILNLQKAISRLQNLKKKIESPDINVIYLLCGKEKGGKYTLAHYLNGSDITFQMDEQGYEILSVKNAKQTEIVVQNIIQIIPSSETQKNCLFIKLQGLLGSNKPDEYNKQWSIVCDYVLSLISRTKAKFKLVFVVSEQQVQDDDQILVKFKNCFNNIRDFQERSHIVLSKLLNETAFDQFVELTVQHIKAAKKQSSYIDQIINRSRVYPFFCRQIDESERENLINDLSSTEVNQLMELKEEGCLTHRILNQNLMKGKNQHIFYDNAKKKLKICLEIVNYSLVLIFYIGCKAGKDAKISQLFKQSWQKIFAVSVQFQPHETIITQSSFRKFMQMYEQLKKLENKEPKQFSKLFFSFFNFISTFWRQNLLQQGIFSLIQILQIICKGFSEQQSQQINFAIYQVFFNHQYGFLQDHIMLKGFQACRQYLSKDFAQQFQKIPPGAQKKKKKSKLRNTIADYQEQKSIYKKFYTKLKQHLNLSPSPLKIDLLIEQLKQRSYKKQTRNFKQQKIIIKNLISLFLIYHCYEQAILLSWVIPDFLSLVNCVILYIDNEAHRNLSISPKCWQLIEKLCIFFSQVKRKQYIEAIRIKIEEIQQSIKIKKQNQNLIFSELKLKIGQILESNNSQQLPELTKKLQTMFMNYEKIQILFTKNNQIIQKCITFEDNHRPEIEQQIVKNWILKGNQLKIID